MSCTKAKMGFTIIASAQIPTRPCERPSAVTPRAGPCQESGWRTNPTARFQQPWPSPDSPINQELIHFSTLFPLCYSQQMNHKQGVKNCLRCNYPNCMEYNPRKSMRQPQTEPGHVIRGLYHKVKAKWDCFLPVSETHSRSK